MKSIEKIYSASGSQVCIILTAICVGQKSQYSSEYLEAYLHLCAQVPLW